ncbi:GDSL esterase/lipase At5g08460-like [Hibiscus syriacus]|uniref:GDSL esterase/lipase At5g08460-like n=1 Tax=Hibiscus syriacus TaxID=106335 RepID=UPI001923DDB8|nr:GDSL esterase/lipase At5g08460-like [Hibiscus syriacus]
MATTQKQRTPVDAERCKKHDGVGGVVNGWSNRRNNEYFNIQFHRNYTPYGIDFGGKSTGRYTNGRTVIDFIAQIVGLPFPPPVQSFFKGKKNIPQTGINYACGFTGLLELSYPPPVSFKTYCSSFVGSLDLGHKWLGWVRLYDADSATKLQIENLSTYLQTLYRLGARKFVINNLAPIGCEPDQIFDGKCWDEANDRALLFNKRLSNLLRDLQSTLSRSKFVIVDLYKIFKDVYASPTSYVYSCSQPSCIFALNNSVSKIPAIYAFGDSYIDSGNNKFIDGAAATFNYLPYGIDFQGGRPTGRTTNGRTVVDFIGKDQNYCSLSFLKLAAIISLPTCFLKLV